MSRFLIFFAVAMSILGGLHYYIYARLIRDTHLVAPWRQIATAALILLAISQPATFIVRRGLGKAGLSALHWTAYIWMGMVFFLFVLMLSADVARVFALLGRKAMGAPALDDPERRKMIGRMIGGAVALIASGIGIVAMRNALKKVAVREVRVPLPNLPRSAHGTTIVQITDVHLGPTIGKGFLEDVVATINAQSPDIIAITGDLVDGSVEELRDAAAPLAQLKAKHGVFFVTGNHEYYAGVHDWMVELERLGIKVLRNERVAIGDGLDLAGIDDFSAHGGGHGPDLPRALDGRDAKRALVLLAHQPRAIWEAAKLGVGLQLSGHTHGGQIFPWNFLVKLQQPFIRGLSKVGDTLLYVSCGTGYWGPPMRLGAPAEVTRVVLEATA